MPILIFADRHMDTTFSIIIPVYNVAPYLRECLDSILSQSFTDWEAICVDDGSTDSSGAILDEYAVKDRRFKIVHKKNGGVSVARNVALDAATGAYVVFVDADDVILRDWLKVFHEVITKDECDVVRARLRYWHGDSGYKHVPDAQYLIVARYTSREAVCSWGVAEVLESGYSVLNCVKREIIAGVKFPIGVRIMEDCIFSAYVMTRANSISVIDYEGYLYRMRESSAIHAHGAKQSIVVDLYDLFVALRNFWSDCCLAVKGFVDLSRIRRVIASFAFRNTMMLGVANRRRLTSQAHDFRKLAEALRGLHGLDAFDMSVLAWYERMAFMVYIKTSGWMGLLLLWKVRAGWDKLAVLMRRKQGKR